MTKVRSIADETPILPHIIADSVIGELSRYLYLTYKIDLQKGPTLADKLVSKASEYYNADKKFRARVKRNPTFGRDWFYCFMRHWLAAELLPLYQAGKIPQSFANGEAL